MQRKKRKNGDMRSPIRFVSLVVALSLAACSAEQEEVPEEGERAAERHAMVREQIEARGLSNEEVLAAMRSVPRHAFVPLEMRELAYADHPLPIGFNQTISQPYIVALMTELSRAKAGDKVFEVGTGSGYQAAVLGALGAEVFTVEIVPELADQARLALAEHGFENVHVRTGDGYVGWPEEAPFDAIVVTAAPERIPPPLLDQLRVGGRMVIPVGSRNVQELRVITRHEDSFEEERVLAVRFVPMTGQAQEPPERP